MNGSQIVGPQPGGGITPNNDSAINSGVPVGEGALKTDSRKYNTATMQNQQIHEEYNSAENLQVIKKMYQEGRARDLADEPKVDGLPCFIIGSGPSLDKSIGFLKTWKGGIVCTTSHALTLMYHGIEPTHIVCLDPFSLWAEIEGVDWSKTRTKLVANPGIWPDLIANWPNEVLMFRQNLGRRDTFYATFQNKMYTRREFKTPGNLREATFYFLVRTEITSFACSPPAQMFIAEVLGYKKLFLAGVDFGCPDGKDRFTNYTVKEQARTITPGNSEPINIPMVWEEHPQPLNPDYQYLPSINGIPTLDIHIYYKKNLLSGLRLSKQEVYTTDRGIITELPFLEAEAVVAAQGEGFEAIDMAEQNQRIEQYLAQTGAYIVESEGGLSFVETPNWQKDLPAYMKALNHKVRCTNCAMEGQINEGQDIDAYEPQPCPQCGHGEIKRIAYIDEAANMRKFERLMFKEPAPELVESVLNEARAKRGRKLRLVK